MTLSFESEAPVEDSMGAERRSDRHVPGEEGLWVFLIGDMLMFALFFGMLLVQRGHDHALWAADQSALHPALGAVGTVLLLCGSYAVVRGVAAYRRGAPNASMWFFACLATAVGFAAVKVTEYTLVAGAGHTPAQASFFMYYFVFTGIHLAHLVIGAVLMLVVALGTRRSVDRPSFGFVEGAGCYWHLVDLLWLVLFPLIYLVR